MLFLDRSLLWAQLLLLFLAGCTAAPLVPGFDGFPLSRVSSLSPRGGFAGSPDQKLIAYNDQGLQLLEAVSDRRYQIDNREARSLAWSRDGERLAAVFVADGEAPQLVVFDRRGQPLEQSALPGTPVSLAWSQHQDLLVAGFTLQIFSFGGNLSQWLVRINGTERKQLELGDFTLKPVTVRLLKEQLSDLLKVSFSPAGDELILMQLHDPPRFNAYLQMVHLNWQVASERKLMQIPPQPVSLAWGDEETICYRSGSGSWVKLSLWGTTGKPLPDPEPVVNPAWLWAADRAVQRFTDGDYLVAVEDNLFSGHGLPVEIPLSSGGREWTLRKWRFEGLIAPEEYREARP